MNGTTRACAFSDFKSDATAQRGWKKDWNVENYLSLKKDKKGCVLGISDFFNTHSHEVRFVKNWLKTCVFKHFVGTYLLRVHAFQKAYLLPAPILSSRSFPGFHGWANSASIYHIKQMILKNVQLFYVAQALTLQSSRSPTASLEQLGLNSSHSFLSLKQC